MTARWSLIKVVRLFLIARRRLASRFTHAANNNQRDVNCSKTSTSTRGKVVSFRARSIDAIASSDADTINLRGACAGRGGGR